MRRMAGNKQIMKLQTLDFRLEILKLLNVRGIGGIGESEFGLRLVGVVALGFGDGRCYNYYRFWWSVPWVFFCN